jgi:hypothetical protein
MMFAPDRSARGWHHAALVLLAFTVSLATATARAALRDGEPPPYITTPQLVVDRMLTLAKVGADDFVVDLGAGDGRIVVTAARRWGARGLGVEIRGDLVALGRKNAEQAGVADRARFEMQDALRTDLAQASVLTLYLGPELNEKLMPRILATMRPGARVVSHDFAIGVWQPDAVERFDVPEKNFGRGGESTIMLWIVPAEASGRWRAEFAGPDGARTEEFSIGQAFQKIQGVLHRGNPGAALRNATLNGPRIRFDAPFGTGDGTLAVSAAIEGDTMKGSVRIEERNRSQTVPFTARRIERRPDLF